MKIAVKTNVYSADITALKSLDSTNLTAQSRRFCLGDIYYYMPFEQHGGIKPDDKGDLEGGRWVLRFNTQDIVKVVDDEHDFQAEGDTDVTDVHLMYHLCNAGELTYLALRDWAETYVAAEGLENLSEASQKTASELFVITKAERDTIYPDEAKQLEHAKTHIDRISRATQIERLGTYAAEVADGDVCCTAEAVIVELAQYSSMDHTVINYITDLKSGCRLHKVEQIGVDGLIGLVEYYHNYVDENDKGTLVLKVEHNWTADESEPIPAARTITEREKTRTWKDTKGNDHKNKKVTTKKYDTRKKQNDEGQRRRDNILHQLQSNCAAIMLMNGTSPDVDDAEVKLTDVFESHNAAVNTYLKSGKGSIYDDITNDSTFTWFDTVVGATAQGYLGLDASWATKTMREYIVDKFKGLV